MPAKKNARGKRIDARNAQLQLKNSNPQEFKLQQEKEAAVRDRRNKRDEEEKAALNSQREKNELLREEEHKLQKLLETEIKNKLLVIKWESVRENEISKWALANFRIGNAPNEHSLIATLFQEVEVVTVFMMTLLWIIFYKGDAYISSGNVNANTSILDQYKDCKDYTVMFEDRSQEIGPTYPFRGKVVYGKRIGGKVNFSNTDVPHLTLPGCVMKKLIADGFVTPVLSC